MGLLRPVSPAFGGSGTRGHGPPPALAPRHPPPDGRRGTVVSVSLRISSLSSRHQISHASAVAHARLRCTCVAFRVTCVGTARSSCLPSHKMSARAPDLPPSSVTYCHGSRQVTFPLGARPSFSSSPGACVHLPIVGIFTSIYVTPSIQKQSVVRVFTSDKAQRRVHDTHHNSQ